MKGGLRPELAKQLFAAYGEDGENLRVMFPETWTNLHNFELRPVCFRLKLLGVDCLSWDEFTAVLAVLTMLGVVQLDEEKDLIRRGEDIMPAIRKAEVKAKGGLRA